MTKVKLCGFQEAATALAAAEAGVDYLGLVFIPSAGRCLQVEQAEALMTGFRQEWGDRPAPQWVGLFGDQPVEEVNAVVARLHLDAVQLCGSEGMGYCQRMEVPVFKVISVDPEVPVSVLLPKLMVLLQRHTMAGHHPVLDTFVAGAYGGTGRSFDWNLAGDLASAYPLSLAGGLTPENVGSAVERARPWGVDTSSGVEVDGRKDPDMIRAFVGAVREADEARTSKRRWLLLRRG